MRWDARQFHECCAKKIILLKRLVMLCCTLVCTRVFDCVREQRAHQVWVAMRRNSGSSATGLQQGRGQRGAGRRQEILYEHEHTDTGASVCVIRFCLRVSWPYRQGVSVVVPVESIYQWVGHSASDYCLHTTHWLRYERGIVYSFIVVIL